MLAAHRIEKFLNDYPEGRLLIAVGYASPAGLYWLNERTKGRPVSLFIGDTRKKFWSKFSDADANGALEFLRRPDVKVRNWYRGNRSKEGPSMAHLKAWLVEVDELPVAALVGSANLTNNGLGQNVEAMAETIDEDLQRTWAKLRGLHEKAWECDKQLREYLGDPGQAQPVGQRRSTNGKRQQSPSAGRAPATPPPPEQPATIGQKIDNFLGKIGMDQ